MSNETPPLVAAAGYLVLLGMATVITVGPAVWYWALRRWWQGQPVLEHEPRALANWGFIDGVILFVLEVVFTGTFAAVAFGVYGLNLKADPTTDTAAYLRLVFLATLARMAACAITWMVIVLRTGCAWRSSLTQMGRDAKLGAAAFCALAIPTYLLHILLTQFWKSAHPLIESLRDQPEPQFLAIVFFIAVVSAPLTEEFIFRVLFQGWLERMFDPWESMKPNFFLTLLVGERAQPVGTATEIVAAQLAQPSEGAPTEVIQAELARPAVEEPIYLGPPPPVSASWSGRHAPPLPQGDVKHLPNQPIFDPWLTDILSISISAGVFALMHYSHGPDWVSLLILAAGLGYLYRRTHRMMPSLTVHFLLNSMSMLALYSEIYRPK
jgi:membrane protease YdiL (CAAX protease family)